MPAESRCSLRSSSASCSDILPEAGLSHVIRPHASLARSGRYLQHQLILSAVDRCLPTPKAALRSPSRRDKVSLSALLWERNVTLAHPCCHRARLHRALCPGRLFRERPSSRGVCPVTHSSENPSAIATAGEGGWRPGATCSASLSQRDACVNARCDSGATLHPRTPGPSDGGRRLCSRQCPCSHAPHPPPRGAAVLPRAWGPGRSACPGSRAAGSPKPCGAPDPRPRTQPCQPLCHEHRECPPRHPTSSASRQEPFQKSLGERENAAPFLDVTSSRATLNSEGQSLRAQPGSARSHEAARDGEDARPRVRAARRCESAGGRTRPGRQLLHGCGREPLLPRELNR